MKTQAQSWPFPTGLGGNAAVITTKRKAYTDDELRIFAKMLIAGATNHEIATKLNRTTKAIANQVSDMLTKKTTTGVLLGQRVRELRVPPYISAAGGQHVVSPPSPAPVVASTPAKPANHRAAWDMAADHQLISEFARGHGPNAIAAVCGRTTASIAGRLHALGFLVFDKDTLTYSTPPKFWHKVVA